jgi:uncharacterized membrane-anchored protein
MFKAIGKQVTLLRWVWLCGLLGMVMTGAASSQEANDDKRKAVWAAADAAMLQGPQTVKLLDQGEIALPDGYGFVPRAESIKVMELMGNQTDERFMGLILPLGDDDRNWFVTLDYEAAGYIKDDEARDWKADELLDSLKEGTEAGNEHRKEVGAPALKVTRWIEKPNYDATRHHLVWSAEVMLKEGEDADPGVNYNTYVLGREGYFSMDLVTSASTVESDKPAAKQLLSAINFNAGKRYADFNSSTDKVAAYGLAALVGGVAIKKLGLLAVIGAFLIKFAKVGILLAAGGAAAIKKFFTRKSDTGSTDA